jgi:hypothetical protein
MASLLRLRVRHPDGQSSVLAVESDKVLVGSGAHCEIRLGPDVAHAEHLVLFVRNGSVYGQAHARGVSLKGRPFEQGRIEPGTSLSIGQVLIEVALVDRMGGGRKKSGAGAYAVVIMLFAVLCFALFKSRRAESAIPPPPKLPEIFVAAPTPCPQKVRDPAQRLALDLTSLAESKRERSPFFPQAGVGAVPLYRQAAACMTVAGDVHAAQLLSQEADALSRQVVDAFTVSRLRLERAISSQDWETVHREVRTQKNFLGAPAPNYLAWLNDVEHRSTVKLAKLAAKKGKKLK